MSWTYADSPGTSTAAERRDAVRLAIGDTDTTDQQITDNGVAWYLSQAANNIAVASIAAVKALIARYSRQADWDNGKTSLKASGRAKAYKELLVQLQKDAASSAGMTVTGQSVSENDGYSQNPDALQPQSTRNQDIYAGNAVGSAWTPTTGWP